MRRLWRRQNAVWLTCLGLIALFPGCGGCPCEPEDKYSDGVGLFLAGHRTAADSAFRELVAEYPHSGYASDAEYFRGAIALEQGQTAQAEDHFRKALASPRNEQMEANAAMGLARCFLARRQYRQAIAQCREFLDGHPASPRADEALYVMAEALEADGQTTEAHRYYRQVAGRFPSGAWASKAQQRLRGETPPPAVISGGGYSVQVMALRKPSDADEHARLLRQRGFPASVVALRSGRSTLHAVRVGPFATRADAERAAARLKAQGFDAILKP